MSRACRVKILVLTAAFGCTAALVAAPAASAHSVRPSGDRGPNSGRILTAPPTVCPSGCAFNEIAPAIAAANRGDTIRLAAGSYQGGVTIEKDIRLVGAGAHATVIHGGGPVLTIGVPDAPSEPTVTIDGVTITGGVAVGNLTPSAGRGGGIYVPRAAGPSTGATVTIRNSVIRDNTAAPSEATDSGIPCPGGGDCPSATAGGGGISNDGTMTLDHVLVTGNRADAASGLTSEASGGGILNRAFGNLTIKNSIITKNHATVTQPNGRFADAGGIEMVAGTLIVDDSLISDNSADVSTAFSSGVETSASTGGVHSQSGAVATIRDTTISGNSATARNLAGDATAFCGGLCTDGSIALSNSTIRNNRVEATTAATLPAGNASADSGALGLGCCDVVPTVTITDTLFTGNSVTAAAPAGVAFASAGAIGAGNTPAPTLTDSVIKGNHATATSTTGSAIVQGAGIGNGSMLTLRNTTIRDNTGTASAPSGVAQGGGIWNGGFPGSPDPQLTLVGGSVTHNTLTASPGITPQGGGLFTTAPVTRKDTRISRNQPDNCFGVSC